MPRKKLTAKQKKLDKNKNRMLDAEDFAILRSEKKRSLLRRSNRRK